jgi:hypothetical protein
MMHKVLPDVIACCMATGHAAGTAAAIAVQDCTIPRNISIEKLQATLKQQNAIL